MEWIDNKEASGHIYGSLLVGNNGVLCRIYKNHKSEFIEDWDGEWSGLLNAHPKCICPPVIISKDLNEVKRLAEEHINKYK